jgi:hypothetical protein
VGLRPGASRGRFLASAALVAAAVFGAWVRAYVLPSAGGWDTDYWMACARRVALHGVTRAYGDPGSIPPGHFLAAARGQEPLWEVEGFGRTFVVDQPPGIMLLWQGAWWASRWLGGGGLVSYEAEAIAAKLPAILGDLLAVGVLLWAFRGEGRRGAVLAALYWALPISWLSSALLGFFDGSFVGLAVAALVMAGRGRAAAAGALVALAALVKATALLVAPAVAAALLARRAPVRRAVAAGVAVVAAALVPFALAGTLPAAVAHCYRIIFQKRLSGGFANPWWLLTEAIAVREGRPAGGPVPFVHIQTVPLPVNAIGAAAFLLIAAWVVRGLWRRPSDRAAALAGGVLVLAYGMVAVGVHENHAHPFVLAMLASGLYTRRHQMLAAVFFTTYVLNMIALSGLGRFYGLRYMLLEPLLPAVQAFRTAPGFDVTLALAVVNIAAFVVLLTTLRAPR